MQHHIISNRTARRVFKAYKDTEGRFNTPASRLLVEQTADKAASMAHGMDVILPDDRKLAAHVMATGACIAPVKDCSNFEIPKHRLDRVKYPDYNNYMVDFSKYEIITSWWSAFKTSYGLTNYLAVVRKSKADKPMLAKDIYNVLVLNFNAIKAKYESQQAAAPGLL